MDCIELRFITQSKHYNSKEEYDTDSSSNYSAPDNYKRSPIYRRKQEKYCVRPTKHKTPHNSKYYVATSITDEYKTPITNVPPPKEQDY